MAGTPTPITTEAKQASGTPNGTASAAAGGWLPQDFRADKSLTRYKDLPDFIKGHKELEKTIGQSLRVPGADATQEERDAFYTRLGRPEAPDKYELKFPEGSAVDEKLLGSYRDAAHKLGLNNQQAQALAEWWTGQSAGMLEAQGAQREAQVAEWNKELDTEWGWQKDRNTALAGRAFAAMLDGNMEHPLIKLMDETGLGNHPAILKFFYEQALKQGEDKLITEPAGPTADDRQSAKEQINSIRGDKEHPYNNPKHPSHKDAIEHVRRLYETIYAKEV